MSAKLRKIVLEEHFTMITTSGVFSAEPLQCAIKALGAGRIMFSVDYPYEYTEEGVKFIESAPITDADREQICHGNAERLLKLFSRNVSAFGL